MERGINKYLKMLLEQNKTEVLGIALHLKLFDYLEKENVYLEDLCKELNTNMKNTYTLLNALVMLELVYKDKNFFQNTDITKKYFVQDSQEYCGDVFLHRKEMLNHGRKAMLNLIIDGAQDIAKAKNPKKWATASKRFLKQEQSHLISKNVTEIIKNLKEFPNLTKMLDLGCASGILGLEIVKSHPNMEGVLFDFPDVMEITSNHISEYSLENRVSILSGNIQNDYIGEGYDLIWCSNVFYFLENKESVFEKVFNALNPGGIFISAHVEIGDDCEEYEDSFFYFLGLNLQGRNILSPMELSNSLKNIGFRYINSYTSYEFPMTPTQIHIAKK